MKILAFVASTSFAGHIALAADSVKSMAVFTDNTKVEVVTAPAGNGSSTLSNIIQIKQTDGTVCYAIVQTGNSSNYPNSISCIRP